MVLAQTTQTETSNDIRIKDLFFLTGKKVNATTIEDIIEEGGLGFTVSKRPLLTITKLPTMVGNNINPNLLSSNGTADTERLKQVVYRLTEQLHTKGTPTLEEMEELRQALTYTHGEFLPLNESFAIVRNDTNDVFATVGRGYTTIENLDCVKILEELMQDHMVQVYRVGMLDKGATCWVAAKLPDLIEINGMKFMQIIRLAWSHDASAKFTARYYFIDQNGRLDSPMIPGTKNEISIRHTKSAKERTVEAKKIIKDQMEYAARYKGLVQALVEFRTDDFAEYMEAIFPNSVKETPDEDGIITKSRDAKVVEKIQSEYNDLGMPNLYGVYSAIKNYAEEGISVRIRNNEKIEGASASQKLDVRMKQNTQPNGLAMKLKQKAWAILTAKVD